MTDLKRIFLLLPRIGGSIISCLAFGCVAEYDPPEQTGYGYYDAGPGYANEYYFDGYYYYDREHHHRDERYHGRDDHGDGEHRDARPADRAPRDDHGGDGHYDRDGHDSAHDGGDQHDR